MGGLPSVSSLTTLGRPKWARIRYSFPPCETTAQKCHMKNNKIKQKKQQKTTKKDEPSRSASQRHPRWGHDPPQPSVGSRPTPFTGGSRPTPMTNGVTTHHNPPWGHDPPRLPMGSRPTPITDGVTTHPDCQWGRDPPRSPAARRPHREPMRMGIFRRRVKPEAARGFRPGSPVRPLDRKREREAGTTCGQGRI